MKIQKLLPIILFVFAFNLTFSQQTIEEDEEEIVEVEDIVESDEDYIERVPFAIIEETPVFPGCTGSNKEKKSCFNKNIQKHVMKDFNSSIANGLGLTPGNKKIFIQFFISSTGNAKVSGIRAPHKKIDQEARRFINSLPKIQPGRHKGKTVEVSYMLPIKFSVSEPKEQKN